MTRVSVLEHPPVDPALLPVPPMTHGAAERVTSTDDVAAIITAYYYPSSRSAVPHAPNLERRQRGRCTLRVFRDTGVVCSVRFTEPDATPARARLDSTRPGKPHRKGRRGGRGNVWPTTWPELRARLERKGCTVQPGGKHWRVTLPNGTRYTLACTASDWRSLRNSALDLRARGVDVSSE